MPKQLIAGFIARTLARASGVIFAAALLAWAAVAAAAGPPPFPHETNPYGLRPDPAFHFLRLQNGLSVVLVPNATPPKEVVVSMGVLAGALDEPEEKAGLAHLLEHLAFQGSRRADEPVFTRLERLGIRAGADANGSTDMTRTEYGFRLPDNAEDKVRALVAIMRDIADGLALDPATIEQERAVVEQERVDRDSAQRRFVYGLYGFLVPDAEAGRHPVSGTKESIAAITREDLVAFYERFYRPENIVLVVAGDLPRETMEAIVRAEFADFRRSSPAPARDLEPEVTVPQAFRAGHFVSADTTPAVLLFSHMPLAEWALADPEYAGRHAPKVPAERREEAFREALKPEIAWQAAQYSFALRLQKLQFGQDPGFAAGGFGILNVPRAAQFLSLTFVPQGDDWRRAMEVMARELTRLIAKGIGDDELRRALDTFGEQLKRAAEQAATRPSARLAAAALDSLTDRRVLRAPSDQLADFEAVRGEVTTADVLAEIRRRFAGRPQAVFLRARQPLESGEGAPDTAVLLAWRKAAQAAAGALAREEREPAAESAATASADGLPYDRFGPPQEPAARSTVAGWDFETWRYQNNLIAHVKRTELEKNKVRFIAHLGEGVGGVPRDKPALMIAGSTLAIFGGLGKADYPTLAPLLNRKGVMVNALFGARGVTILGEVTAAEFPFAMRYLAALLSDAAFREGGLALVHRILQQQYAVWERAPDGVYLLHGAARVYGGDARFVGIPPRFADLEALKADEVAAFMRPILKQEFLELSVVGDIAPDAVRAALATTLAALPARAAEPARLTWLPAPWLTQGETVQLTYAGKDVGSRVILTWPLADERTREEAVALDVLADALAIMARERVREGARLSYSPSASADLDRRAGYRGALTLSADGPSGRSAEVAHALEDLLHELASRPVDADILRRAKEPQLKAIEKIRDTNQSWLFRVLDGLARDPDRLHRLETARDLVAAVRAEDVQRAAESVLRSAPHPWRFLIEPAQPGGSTP